MAGTVNAGNESQEAFKKRFGASVSSLGMIFFFSIPQFASSVTHNSMVKYEFTH